MVAVATPEHVKDNEMFELRIMEADMAVAAPLRVSDVEMP